MRLSKGARAKAFTHILRQAQDDTNTLNKKSLRVPSKAPLVGTRNDILVNFLI